MPISAEKMKLYPGGSIRSQEWLAIRADILRRADHKCEFCRAPNSQVIFRFTDEGSHFYMLENGAAHDEQGNLIGYIRGSEMPRGRFTKVVLTIMHLDHDPRNNAAENLMAGCQRCHNAYDSKHRRGNAERTRRCKGGQADMFAPPPEPSE